AVPVRERRHVLRAVRDHRHVARAPVQPQHVGRELPHVLDRGSDPRRLVRVVLHVLPDLRAPAARVLGGRDQGNVAAADAGDARMIGRMIDSLLTGPPTAYEGVMGVYYYVDDVAGTVTALREQGHQ